ncbi:MAG: hypothetical protein E7016_00745 [Alphaproteobacteria bacterium]|nr:hypothetical protein [Alphaproteobacteria bacterium]
MRKVCELGRSMVEMLGVLAIIGVLSVGGIAGYSKAMMKHKMNEHRVMLNSLINTLFMYADKVISFNNNSTETVIISETFYKSGLLPDDVRLYEHSTDYLRDVFNNSIWLFTNPYAKQVGMGYTITGNETGREICVNLINVAKENSANLFQILSDKNDGNDNYTTHGRYYGDKFCTQDVSCIRNITFNDIDILCNNCYDRSCRFYTVIAY